MFTLKYPPEYHFLSTAVLLSPGGGTTFVPDEVLVCAGGGTTFDRYRNCRNYSRPFYREDKQGSNSNTGEFPLRIVMHHIIFSFQYDAPDICPNYFTIQELAHW